LAEKCWRKIRLETSNVTPLRFRTHSDERHKQRCFLYNSRKRGIGISCGFLNHGNFLVVNLFLVGTHVEASTLQLFIACNLVFQALSIALPCFYCVLHFSIFKLGVCLLDSEITLLLHKSLALLSFDIKLPCKF